MFNLFSKPRYCPKCGIPMEKTKVDSNSKSIGDLIKKKTCYTCPKCNGVLMS